MKAQILYNFRNEWEFCSGTDLHDFFREQLGDPSPSGQVEIGHDKADEFVERSIIFVVKGSPSLKDWGTKALEAWAKIAIEFFS
jgi:hypothetical protein